MILARHYFAWTPLWFRPILLLAIMVTFSPNAHAFASAHSEDASSFADFNGALRFNAGYAHFNSGPNRYLQIDDTDRFMTTSVVRFISVGTIADRMDFELDAFGVFGSVPVAAGTAMTHAGLTRSTYRTRHLSSGTYQQSVFNGYGLDRAFIRITGERTNLSLGRMPINYSIASLFAVNDFFAPFSATSINTVYKPGVDSAKLAIRTGDLSGIELVAAMGHDRRHSETDNVSARHSAVLLYAHRLAGPVDLGLTLGRLATKWMMGVSAQGDIGPISFYTEGHFAYSDGTDRGLRKIQNAEETTPAVQGTAGLRWMTDWRQLTVSMEYAYLSNGVSVKDYGRRYEALAQHPDEFPYVGTQYGGIAASLALHPLL
ncbi:MAG: hypothetical protein JXX14_10825, partial [Deltaproteobacteria bacterium]|nr:hypothetical protein [Deltaproteobacteria bacterium]